MKQIVAITGGSRGIGAAIGKLFASRGAKVVSLSRATGDVRDRASVNLFVQTAVRKYGRLDVFINCAGVSLWKPLADIDEEFMSQIYETNVNGTLWGCAAASVVMKKGGSIVNVSSLAGKRGSTNNSAYCASKFAVNGITQSLAKELGPRGIRVNAVCPVYVTTKTVLKALEETFSPAKGKNVKNYLAEFAKTQTALGRLPTENEVAEAVYFLAGSAASAITGQCINVDCGTLPQ